MEEIIPSGQIWGNWVHVKDQLGSLFWVFSTWWYINISVNRFGTAIGRCAYSCQAYHLNMDWKSRESQLDQCLINSSELKCLIPEMLLRFCIFSARSMYGEINYLCNTHIYIFTYIEIFCHNISIPHFLFAYFHITNRVLFLQSTLKLPISIDIVFTLSIYP